MPPALSRVSTFESAVSDESDDEFHGEVGGAHGGTMVDGGVRIRTGSTASALGEWLWHGREAESREK